jgi:site-specific DNA recombinase
MRAVIYDRVSVKDASSQEEHLRRCHAYAASQDWQVVAEHVDTASGFKRDVVRPGWEQVRQLVDQRKVDAVVVFAVSRAGRNAASLLKFVEECRDANVVFASATEPISTGGQYGSVFVAILGAIAEMESQMKRDRALVGRTVAKREGTWTGGRRPYGFQSVQDPPKGPYRLVLDKEEAGHIRRAAEVVLNGGSLSAAAEVMNAAGARTITGKPWYSASMGPLLSRDVNAPDIMSSKTLGKVKRAVKKRAPAQGRRPRYLMTGIARCGICGGTLKGKPVSGILKYICTNTGSLHLSVAARLVDEVVTFRLSSAVVDSTVVRDPGDAPEELAAELRQLEERLEQLGEQVEAGELSESAFRGRERKLQARADELEAKIEEASETMDVSVYTEPPHKTEEDYYGDPAVRAWVETLVDHVTVLPVTKAKGRDRVRITLRKGVSDA